MNQKGSSLLLVLLVTLIFMTLGMAILSASIGGAKRTEFRKVETITLQESIKSIDEVIARLKVYTLNVDITKTTPIEYEIKLNEFLLELIDEYELDYDKPEDIDISLQYNVGEQMRQKLYTRVYQIRKKAGNKIVSRNVIISASPSFLKYALGSRTDVTLNGGTYIDGNIYVQEDFYVSNSANYIYNGYKKTTLTTFPTTSPTSLLFAKENMYSCSYGTQCYQVTNSGDFIGEQALFSRVNKEGAELNNSFKGNAPIYQKSHDEFIDVDVMTTFADKLFDAAGASFSNPAIRNRYSQYLEDKENTDDNKRQVIDNLLDDLKSSYNITNNFIDFEDLTQQDKSILVESTNGTDNIYVDVSCINFKGYYFENNECNQTPNTGHYLNSHWLIFDGNAFFENTGTERMNIAANILVTGDVFIRGDIAFDSTLYVLGDATIYNADISGVKDQNEKEKEIVMIVQGELNIARINEFTNSSDKDENLRGYFYTNSNAILYAVGSNINIRGGLFAKGNSNQLLPNTNSHGLVINTFRGNAEESLGLYDKLLLTQSEDLQKARFKVIYDKNIFIEQQQGLPLVNKLDLIADDLVIK
ncbi:hypothetical protein IMZ08_08850 [Bacillus luteolus]|uniref:Uncharacterized protein n=1 Tax=Litchfieldia luteola TaxID=682179 RepID=A0ABR9QIA8_9BACI|nr:hypothetical protein [Cytobacillus luteolus]MBE4908161.1 hypothetical protein [Cytobacillus luteolus]MBP1942946.1 hypothetical protein [Cytobacillus luteolus]